jgi:hypothetical protein
VLQWLGWFDLLPDPLRARGYFEEALEIAQRHGALQLVARLSRFLVWAGDALDAPLSEQRQLLDQALVAAQASDDAQMEALIQGDLGWLDFRQGRERDGKRRLTESLMVLRGQGEPSAICSSVISCAAVALEQRDTDGSRAMLEEALGIARALRNRITVYQALMLLGELSRDRGDLPSARASIAAALREVRNTGLRPMLLTALRAMAGCRLAMGNSESAARLFGAEAQMRAGASVPSTLCPPLMIRLPIRYAEDLALARTNLGVEKFETAWAAGQATPLEAALADALEEIRR